MKVNNDLKSRTYSFYKVYKFGNFSAKEHLSLDLFEGETSNRRTPLKIVKTKHKKNGAQIYNVFYDQKKDQEGYFSQSSSNDDVKFLPITNFYIPHVFKAYYYKNLNLVLFNVSYKVSDAFLKEIKGFYSKKPSNNDIQLEKFDIDLEKEAKSLDIRGLWMGFQNIPTLSSSGLFGLDITSDSTVSNLTKRGGKITSILISYDFKDLLLTISLSKNGSIFIPNAIKESEALALAKTLIDLIT